MDNQKKQNKVTAFFETIKDSLSLFFETIKERFSLIFQTDKKLLIIILCVLVLFLLLIIFSFAFWKKPEKPTTIPESDELVDSIYYPEEPSLSRDYLYSRKQHKFWLPDEVGQYFSIPDEQMLNDLNHSNELLLKNIFEAAP